MKPRRVLITLEATTAAHANLIARVLGNISLLRSKTSGGVAKIVVHQVQVNVVKPEKARAR